MRTSPIGGSNKLFTTRQAAAYLAIDPRTLREFWRSWELPAVKLGKELKFRQRDLDSLIQRRTVTP